MLAPRTRQLVGCIWLSAILGLTAAEAPPPAYVAAMKTLATVAAEMPKRLAANDAAGMERLVIDARPAIATIEEYWSRRGDDEAGDLVATASKSLAEISVAAHLLKDGPNPLATEGAEQSIRTLTSTCTACHAARRDRLPDGSFAIK